MRLCFGTFAGLLNHCRKKSINQTLFIGRVAWVVDRKTSCLRIFSKSDDEEGKNASITEGDLKKGLLEGNSAVVSKLLACKQNYENRSGEYTPFLNAKKALPKW